MRAKKIVGFVAIVITLFLISSCALFKKEDKDRVYDKGKEGKWVYSTQKPSPYGDQKQSTTYDKSPQSPAALFGVVLKLNHHYLIFKSP